MYVLEVGMIFGVTQGGWDEDAWSTIASTLDLRALIARARTIEGVGCDDDDPAMVIACLRRAREAANTDRAAIIDQVLVPLLNAARMAQVVDLDAHRHIPASAYDVLITDIRDTDMLTIDRELMGCGLDVHPSCRFPVHGMIYGDYQRVFVALSVRKRATLKRMLFLVDTGSPFTFLRHDALTELGFHDALPMSTEVFIHGTRLAVAPSHGHFSNVNLLGQNYMQAAKLRLEVDYVTGEVVLLMPSHV